MTYAHRRAQVRWDVALASVDRALDLAPEWEEAHHVYATALVLAGWSEAADRGLEQARADGTWTEMVRWAELADQAPGGFWRRGRLTAWSDALDRLGRPAEAAAVRARLAPPALPSLGVRFGDLLELRGLELPGPARPGDTVTIRYHWRLLRPARHDYWAFLHIRGLAGVDNEDQPIGPGDFGTSQWAPGEEVRQTVSFRVPPGASPGSYPIELGVWLPRTRQRLRVSGADVPFHRGAIAPGVLIVSR